MASRQPLLFLAVLLIPAVLVGAWAVLRFGGSIDRLVADEVHRAEMAAAPQPPRKKRAVERGDGHRTSRAVHTHNPHVRFPPLPYCM